jgi:hypothetical protein
MTATVCMPGDFSSLSFSSTQGVSEDFAKIANAAKSFRQYLAGANVAYGHIAEISQAIDYAASNATIENWDDEGGLPVSGYTVSLAKRFASALPSDIEIPEIYAESHGELTFEWRSGKGRIVAISVYPNGTIGYSSLIGASKVYGWENFISSIPAMLIHRIARVYA